ncbi:MAG: hypothetical protein Q9208_004520 [Pyrenodesmia sp. 3 TL-2023]
MATMDYETENGRYEDEPRYDRDRSASPRPIKRDDDYNKRDDTYRGGRDRSASPNGRMDSRGPAPDRGGDERGDRNPGSNLFVTGIHPRLNEADVTRLFEKYGDVEGCSIMKDPHTQESRGFGFVKMVTGEQADAAKEGLQGENIEGRTLSIEKARRSRPRTPTPGKYFGPPKRATVDLLATTTVAMDAAMTTDLEALTAMLRAVMTATAAVEMIDVAGPTTVVVTNHVAMAGILLLRGNPTAEVGATTTATIGTLVVRMRTANILSSDRIHLKNAERLSLRS